MKWCACLLFYFLVGKAIEYLFFSFNMYVFHSAFCIFVQLTDQTRYYIASDNELMIDIFKSEINFLKSSWQNMLGRPLVIMTINSIYLGKEKCLCFESIQTTNICTHLMFVVSIC